MADPTTDEESLCSGIITIVLKDAELCCVHKPGGSPLTDEELLKCIEKAKERVPYIKGLIESVLEE